MKALQKLLARHKAGSGEGIYSVCSSHPLVVEAALREAVRAGQWVLLEATSNQVNQFGGYTGMTPAQFRLYVQDVAAAASLRTDSILLGGDHLGPNAWRAEPPVVAMAHAEQLVTDYVAAGFRKIHLDCSMGCAGDPEVLTDAVIAQRAARLCRAAERAWHESGGEAPVYVVGTEVPVPGGAAEELGPLAVTTPDAVTGTLEAHREAFTALGLTAAWDRTIALVVQPGVEFDHHKVIDYDPIKARELSRRIEREPTVVYEAHSTDYQTPEALAALVRDHFAILKVGPAATFALREALWALVDIQLELDDESRESLKEVVLAVMQREPRHWQPYYTDPASLNFDRQYSLSDRIRYYWNDPDVQRATTALLDDLGRRRIPMTLLSQYLPAQYAAVREGSASAEPRALVVEGVARVLRGYADACEPATPGIRRAGSSG